MLFYTQDAINIFIHQVHVQNWKQIQCDYFDIEYAQKFYACHGSNEKLLFLQKMSNFIVVLKAKNMDNMCQIAFIFSKKCFRGYTPDPHM